MPKALHKLNKFEGGINNNSDAKDIESNQVSDATDAYFGKVGQISTLGRASSSDTGLNDIGNASATPGYGLGSFKGSHSINQGDSGSYTSWSTPVITSASNGQKPFFVINVKDFYPHPITNTEHSTTWADALNAGHTPIADINSALDNWGMRIHISGTVGAAFPDISYPTISDTGGAAVATDENGTNTTIRYETMDASRNYPNDNQSVKWFKLLPTRVGWCRKNFQQYDGPGIGHYFQSKMRRNPDNSFQWHNGGQWSQEFSETYNSLEWLDRYPDIQDTSVPSDTLSPGYTINGRSNLLMALAAMMSKEENTEVQLCGTYGNYTSLIVYLNPDVFSGDFTPANKYIWVEFRHYASRKHTSENYYGSLPFHHHSSGGWVPTFHNDNYDDIWPIADGASVQSLEESTHYSSNMTIFDRHEHDYNFLSIPEAFKQTGDISYPPHPIYLFPDANFSQIQQAIGTNSHVDGLCSHGWNDDIGNSANVTGVAGTRRVLPGLDATTLSWVSTLQESDGGDNASAGESYQIKLSGINVNESITKSQVYAATANDQLTEIVATLRDAINPTYGSDVVADGNMSNASSWTAATGWAVNSSSSGVAASSSGDAPILSQDFSGKSGWAVNTWWKIVLDVNRTSGKLYVDLGDNTGGNKKVIEESGTNITLHIKTPSSFNGELLRFYGGAFRGSIDNVEAYLVTNTGVGGLIADVPSGAQLRIQTTGLGQNLPFEIEPGIVRIPGFSFLQTPTEIISYVDSVSDLRIADSSIGIWSDMLNNNNTHYALSSIINSSSEPQFSTTVNHGYSNDDLVVIQGTADYDGLWKIKNSSGVNFKITTPYVSALITSDTGYVTKTAASGENNANTLVWPDSGAKPIFYSYNGKLRFSDSNFSNKNNKPAWLGYIKKDSLFNQTGTGSDVDIEGWYVKEQELKLPKDATDWIEPNWNTVNTSTLLTEAQRTFLGDVLNEDDSKFDFGGNTTGGADMLNSDGFVAASSGEFDVSSGSGRFQNGAASQGAVSIALTTVVGATYQIKFDVTGRHANNPTMKASLSTTTSTNNDAAVTVDSDSSTGNILAAPFTATGTTSYLVLLNGSSTSGDWIDIDNLEIYQTAQNTGKLKLNIDTSAFSGTEGGWPQGKYKLYLTALFDDGTETLPAKTDTQGLMFFNGTDYFLDISETGKVVTLDFEVDTRNNNGMYSFDERMKGFRVYIASEDESYVNKYHFFDVDFKNGLIRGDGLGRVAWENLNGSTYGAKVSSVRYATDKYGLGFDEQVLYPEDSDIIGGIKYKAVTIANNRTFIANVKYDDGISEVHYPDRVIGSAINKMDTFPIPDGILDFVISDGDETLALENFSDRLLQFKKDCMYIINISDYGKEFLEEEHRWKGVSSPYHVVWTANGVIWANEYSVYIYNGKDVQDLMMFSKGNLEGNRKISRSKWSSFFSSNSLLIYEPNDNQIIIKKSTTGNSAQDNGDIYLLDLDNGGWSYGRGRFVNNAATYNAKQTNAITLSDGSIYIINSIEQDDNSGKIFPGLNDKIQGGAIKNGGEPIL
tara:strand:- start:23754 stop:28361 length:4608 start_codon:yes stop_codon:yes gene_type:complete